MNGSPTSKTLSRYLAEKIATQRELGKTEERIAQESGYKSPRLLQMITLGETKLPLDQVLPLSRALNVEPAELFELALRQFLSDQDVDELCRSFEMRAVLRGTVSPLTTGGHEHSERTRKQPSLEELLGKEEFERPRYSLDNYAFSGALEFDMSITVFGKVVHRKARVVWENTPDWDYFDLKQERVVKGWGSDTRHVEILAVPEREAWAPGDDGTFPEVDNAPVWKQIDLLGDGILTVELEDEIDQKIDEQCREEDAARRERFGQG